MPTTERATVAGVPVDVLVARDPGPDAVALWPSIGEYPCYDEVAYGLLAADDERNKRFRVALKELAPDKVVLDLGAGGGLLWARQSVAAGARRAVALEQSPTAFAQAALTLAESERIVLIRGRSDEVQIAPRADVCVAEIIGSFAGAEGAAAVLADARQRHLVPGGVVIPDRATTLAAAVNLRELFGGAAPAFAADALPHLSTIFAWNGAPFDVRLRLRAVPPDRLLSTSAPIEDLAFNGDLVTEQAHTVCLDVTRVGAVDGILAWLSLSCLPGGDPLDVLETPCSWASIYVPLFDEPVLVRPGEKVDLRVETTLGPDGLHPDYRFAARLRTATGETSGSFDSPHRGTAFRSTAVHRALFPAGG